MAAAISGACPAVSNFRTFLCGLGDQEDAQKPGAPLLKHVLTLHDWFCNGISSELRED